MRGILRLVSAVCLLGIPGLALAQSHANPEGDTRVLGQFHTDHHMHVHSPAILEFLPSYCSSPGRVGACDPVFLKPLTIDDLLSDMDVAGIRRGWLMSTAYLAQSPMMVPPAPAAHEIMMSANEFTVQLAQTYPDRISAFIGLNPIADNALVEIQRWKGNPAVTGIKLHLTNSDVDLRAPAQIEKLAAVFSAAADNGFAIMIHMRTRAEDYGARDVAVFVEQVLPHARGGPVIIAHSGGWGGTNEHTLSALDGFAEALERDQAIGRNVFFDLAQVFDDTTPLNDLDALVSRMRRIGVDHFLPGSDWPFSGDLTGYYAEIYPLLPLTAEEWSTIRTVLAVQR